MKNIYFITLFFISSIVQAQDLNILWQNTIGGDDDDRLYTMDKTTDGGFILGGRSLSNISGDKTEDAIGNGDFWVVKVDSNGEIEWQNTIGGTFDDHLYSINQTSDGGYILGGISNSNISGDKTENVMGALDYWIVKINSLGDVEWDNTVGGNGEDYLYSIEQTFDDGYYLGGYSNSNISGDKTENSMGENDIWVVKLNENGIVEWDNTIGGSNYDSIRSLFVTSDGGSILGGTSGSDISGDKTENSIGLSDFWVVKLNPDGLIEWQNTIGGTESDWIESISQTSDGGYIVGGVSESDISGDKTENSNGGFDFWVIKLDNSGTVVWQNTIGGNNIDTLKSICETDDGGFFIAGSSTSDISGDKTENTMGGSDYWVVKLNSLGSIEGQNTIGGNNAEAAYSAVQLNDGSFLLSGFSNSDISGDKTEDSMGEYDYWILKLSATLGLQDILKNVFNLYPNPVQETLNIESQQQLENVKLYNLQGQLIKEVSSNNVDVSQLSAGLYFVKVTVEGKSQTQKFIKK